MPYICTELNTQKYTDMESAQKKTKSEISKMPKRELSAYLIEITQTPICKDKEYCDFLTKAFLKA